MVPSYRGRLIRRSLVGAVMLAVVGFGFQQAFREFPTLWVHAADGSWYSDDPRSIWTVAAIVAAIVAMAMLWEFLDRVTMYAVATVAGAGTGLGWGEAWSNGLVSDATGMTWAAVSAVFAVGGAVLLAHGVVQLRNLYGYPERGRSDRRTAIARPHHREDAEPATAIVAFADDRGVRHDVRATVPAELRHRPLVAIYDPRRPDDPSTLHIGALYAPEDERARLWDALKARFPADGDELMWEDEYTRDPGMALRAGLARIVERRRAGELTADEFTTAKWRALAAYVEDDETVPDV